MSVVYPGIVFLEETSINFVSLWIRLIRAALASSSSSNLDCILTCPSSNYIANIDRRNKPTVYPIVQKYTITRENMNSYFGTLQDALKHSNFLNIRMNESNIPAALRLKFLQV